MPILYQLIAMVILVAVGAGLAFQAGNKLGYILIIAAVIWGFKILPNLTAMGRTGPTPTTPSQRHQVPAP
ncbi:MAG: hypothetical protein N2111_10605 [Candidatus Sumerlaeaceae bacterium]|jgi:hypothetical protein|nr:hypothetical protein [Candidatus Sumerlaeaceae bacterium]